MFKVYKRLSNDNYIATSNAADYGFPNTLMKLNCKVTLN